MGEPAQGGFKFRWITKHQLSYRSVELVEVLPSGADGILLRAVNNFETQDSIHNSEMFTKYSLWYLHHLRERIDQLVENRAWQIQLARILPALSDLQTPIGREDASRELNRVLRVICETVHSGQSSLSAIASELDQRNQPESGSQTGPITDNRTVDPMLYQLLFTLMSWVFMLYTPASIPSPGVLRLELLDIKDNGRHIHTASWRQLSCPMTEDKIGLTLENLLRCFGDFEPKGPPRPSYGSRSLFFDDSIISSNLSYWTLKKVAGVHIEWVDAISLHLEFDERTLALKVFRFPSFCAMLAIPRDAGSTIFQK
jgi:hypothetical protein